MDYFCVSCFMLAFFYYKIFLFLTLINKSKCQSQCNCYANKCDSDCNGVTQYYAPLPVYYQNSNTQGRTCNENFDVKSKFY